MLDRASAAALFSLMLFLVLAVMQTVHVLNCHAQVSRLEPAAPRIVVVPRPEPSPMLVFVSCPSSRVAEDDAEDPEFEQKPLSAFRR